MGKQYEMAFQIGAKVQGSFGTAFKSAAGSVQGLQKTINELNKKQSDISSYQKTQTALEQTKNKLQLAEQQYANMKAAIEANENASYQEQNAMLAKAKTIDDLKAKQEQLEGKLESTGRALQEEGVDLDNMGQASQEAKEQVEALRKEQEELATASEQSGNSAAEAAQAFMDFAAAAGALEIGKTIGEALKQCTDEAIAFESSMAAVKRTVGGDDDFIGAMAEEFKTLSTEIPITKDELAKIATTAGQLGIAKADVEKFTKTMAMLATTTDLSADEAATMVAQFANITGVDDYERLGSVIASLGDSTATTASKVVQMSQGMAASATIAGMSSTDIMAIAAAVGSLGIEAQAGSTAMSTLISTLHKSTETGDKLEEFAAVAGMTAEQFKEAWGKDAVGAMNAFIQGLNNTERNGKSAVVILDELGISNVRQTKAILGLANAGDLLAGTISQANTAWSANTALSDKAAIMYGTTESKLTMMQNAFSNVKVAIGDAFTPAIGGAADAVTGLMQPVADFIEQNPALVQGIGAAIAVMGGLTAAMAAYTAGTKAATAISTAFKAAIGAEALGPILAIGSAIAVVTGAVVGLSAAFRDNSKSMKEMDAEYDALMEEYKSEQGLIDLCEQYKALSKEIQSANRAEMETDAANFKAKAESMKKDLEAAKKSLAELEKMKSQIEARITNAASEEDLGTLRDKLADVTAAIIDQKLKVGVLEVAYGEAEKQYEETAQAVETLTEKDAQLQEKEAQIRKAAGETAGAYSDQARSIMEIVEAQEQLAKARQAETRAELLGSISDQVKGYTKGLKDNAEAMTILTARETTLANAGNMVAMSADEANKAYQGLLQELNAMQNAEGFDPLNVDYQAKIDQVEAFIRIASGYADELNQMNPDDNFWIEDWADAFGYIATNAETWGESIAGLSNDIATYGSAIAEANADYQAFLDNLVAGVDSGAVTIEEVKARLMDAFENEENGAQLLAEALEYVTERTQEAAQAQEELAAAQEEGVDTQAVIDATQPIIEKMNELAESYRAAYDAAYQSISGQFQLFERVSLDKESAAAKTSVDDMINNLKSQSAYITEFEENMQKAIKMGISEGLLAELSDGSTESAQYLQEIVNNGSGMIDDLNNAFAEVEQGKAKFADTVAEMQTDFSASMKQLEADLQTTIGTMDKSAETAASGSLTVKSYAEGALSQLPAVQDAFAQLSAVAQIKAKVSFSVGGLSFGGGTGGFNIGKFLGIPGFAGGTESAPEGWAWVGEHGPELMHLQGGERILNAQESKTVTADSAAPSGSGGGYHIDMHNQFDISGASNPEEIKAVVEEATQNLRGQIEEIISDVEEDRRRRAYV